MEVGSEQSPGFREMQQGEELGKVRLGVVWGKEPPALRAPLCPPLSLMQS